MTGSRGRKLLQGTFVPGGGGDSGEICAGRTGLPVTGQVYHCEPNEENYTDTALIFVDMKNRWLLSAAVLFSAVCANPASALERGPQYHYDKGVELYERQQYGFGARRIQEGPRGDVRR